MTCRMDTVLGYLVQSIVVMASFLETLLAGVCLLGPQSYRVGRNDQGPLVSDTDDEEVTVPGIY